MNRKTAFKNDLFRPSWNATTVGISESYSLRENRKGRSG